MVRGPTMVRREITLAQESHRVERVKTGAENGDESTALGFENLASNT